MTSLIVTERFIDIEMTNESLKAVMQPTHYLWSYKDATSNMHRGIGYCEVFDLLRTTHTMNLLNFLSLFVNYVNSNCKFDIHTLKNIISWEEPYLTLIQLCSFEKKEPLKLGIVYRTS